MDQVWLERIATERACPVNPSVCASLIAAGPSLAKAPGVQDNTDVRFIKSITDKPDEKRAERAVGNTWLDPPT